MRYSWFMAIKPEDILFIDEHFLILYKREYRPVQDDKSGELSLLAELKTTSIDGQFLLPETGGLCHRIDRPVLGLVVFARTPKALAAFNEMLKSRKVQKTYWAVVEAEPPRPAATLTDLITKNEKTNRSRVSSRPAANPAPAEKQAELSYKTLGKTDRYWMLEVSLSTGRHHQIRAQLSHMGCPIKGDIKYGARRTNPGGGISLFSRSISFAHPFGRQLIEIKALPLESPKGRPDPLWACFPDQ